VSDLVILLNLCILDTSLFVLQVFAIACKYYNIEIQKYTNVCLNNIDCNKNCCEVNTKYFKASKQIVVKNRNESVKKSVKDSVKDSIDNDKTTTILKKERLQRQLYKSAKQ